MLHGSISEHTLFTKLPSLQWMHRAGTLFNVGPFLHHFQSKMTGWDCGSRYFCGPEPDLTRPLSRAVRSLSPEWCSSLLLLVTWFCPVTLVLTLSLARPFSQPNHLIKLQRIFVGFFSDLKSQISWHKPMHKRDCEEATRLEFKPCGESKHHSFGVPPCHLPWFA